MSFPAELEKHVSSFYIRMLEKTQVLKNGPHKTLYCDSFGKIIETVKVVLIEGSNKGLAVLEIANNLIFTLLQKNFFVYANHRMALLIGYFYLKRQGVSVSNFSLDAVTNQSTLDEIKAVTAAWLQ